MRFMTFVTSSLNSQSLAPPPALMQAIMQIGMEATQAGVLVEQGGLLPMAAGGSISSQGGELTVTDGPYAEAREVIGGYAVYELPTRADAMDWARRFMDLHRRHWPEWEGSCEVRQIMDQPGAPR